ncbi:hypothetical protein V7201_02190 [Bacillus sp. JJ1122]|uniref:hypothetical protein n=1 Tax=Bacillus sp. JJ1122 TaxID=3122951 RepID=UPI002FFDB8F1
MELKDLITILVEQNKNYKDMLTWSIGSIITILVIFLTANFFTMRKFREDEIEKIKASVLLDLKNNSIPSLKQEVNDQLDLKFTQQISTVESKVTQEISTLESKFTQEISTLESKFTQEISTVESKVTQQGNTVNSKVNSLERMLKDLSEDNSKLEGRLYELTGDFYTENEVFINAFSYYLRAGTAYHKADSMGFIPNILRKLEKTAGNLPHVQSEIRDFNIFASLLTEENKSQSDKIRDILVKVTPL